MEAVRSNKADLRKLERFGFLVRRWDFFDFEQEQEHLQILDIAILNHYQDYDIIICNT
jgi:hypothetical protein